MKKLYAFLLLTFWAASAFAQYFSSGEDPALVKYHYIKSPHFKVVYPNGANDYAFRLASMLEQSYRNVQFSKLFKTRNINVLVHTHNSIANGFVSWAPKRMELMALPPYEFNSVSWERDLAIHEFRHVSQISSLYSGLTGLSYYILGEQGIGIMTSLVPLWFYEGDAVYAETAFTQAGRGRSSDFGLAYRVRLNEGYRFKFDQYLNGSYKTYFPSYYELGYLMTTYARLKYGQNVWDSIMRYTTRNPYLINSFTFGIKKYTHHTKRDLFHKTLTFFDSTWNKSLDEPNYSPTNKVYREEYVDYSYPIFVGNKLYCFKTTLDRNPELISIDSKGHEQKHKTVGSVNSYPTTDGKSIFWTEYAFAGRWSQEKFSILKRYDIGSDQSSLVSDFGYYSYPAVKGDTIAVLVNNTDSNRMEIGLYNGKFNKIEKFKIPFSQAKDLQWVGDDLVYTTLNFKDSMIVVKQSVATKQIDTLYSFGRRNMKRALLRGDSLTFISDVSGVSSLYSYSLAHKSTNLLYHPTYAIGGYAVDSLGGICVQDYTASGFRIAKATLASQFVPAEALALNYPIASTITSLEKNINLQDSTEYRTDFKVRKYNKFSHLFNFHSWAPFYFDPSEVQNLALEIYPGITLISQNLLSTSFTSLAYGYKSGGHIVDISYTYKGWLPVFNLRLDRYNSMPTLFSINNHPYVRDSSDRRFQLGLSAYLPLQFSYGAWNGLIQPYFEYSHYNDILYSNEKSKYVKGLDQFTASFYAAWQMRQAPQNIYPRWGVNFYFKNVFAPYQTDNLGRLYAYRVGVFAPGLFANHGIMVRAFYQKQSTDRFFFSNAFSLPRGYNTSSFLNSSYQAIFTDYTFPIAYPDFNVSWLVYLKRIRANLFADFGERTYPYYQKVGVNSYQLLYPKQAYSSYGVDILFDFHALRTSFPMTSGTRISYNNNGQVTWNYFFSITVN